ncbi:MAG: hypothetical protein ACMUIA_08645 [bacterium]
MNLPPPVELLVFSIQNMIGYTHYRSARNHGSVEKMCFLEIRRKGCFLRDTPAVRLPGMAGKGSNLRWEEMRRRPAADGKQAAVLL